MYVGNSFVTILVVIVAFKVTNRAVTSPLLQQPNSIRQIGWIFDMTNENNNNDDAYGIDDSRIDDSDLHNIILDMTDTIHQPITNTRQK